MKIGRCINLHRSEASSLADTLDAFSAAVFLADGDCQIRYSNLSGRQMLDAGVVLRTVTGKLTPVHRAAGPGCRARSSPLATVTPPSGRKGSL